MAYYFLKPKVMAWVLSTKCKAIKKDNDNSLDGETLFNEALLEKAYEYCAVVQNSLLENYAIDQYRWHFNQEESQLEFYHSDDALAYKAKAQILGSHSKNSGSWVWSKFNDSILDVCKEQLDIVWETLSAMDENFDSPKFVDEKPIRDYISIGVLMLQAQGWYVGSTANADIYFIINKIQNA